MILDIEREWHREPGWFDSLDAEQQALLFAERRVRAREQSRGRRSRGEERAIQRATKRGQRGG